MQIIPLLKIPAQSFSVRLDGQNCVISLIWRQSFLYLTLKVDGKLIRQNLICLNLANILQGPVLDFKGTLHFFDIRGDREPTWADLDERCFLIFAPQGQDLPANLDLYRRFAS